MDCPNCNEPLEKGAAYCGNCGQKLAEINHFTEADTTRINDAALLQRRHDQTRASMAIALGLIGTAASLVIPLVALALGVVGSVLATLSRRDIHTRASMIGLVCSVIAVLAGFGTITYALSHNESSPAAKPSNVTNRGGKTVSQTTATLSTPCYNVGFQTELRVDSVANSCDITAYDGDSLDASSDAYKVYGVHATIPKSGFEAMAKTAIEKDIKSSLPDYQIDTESFGIFAGSQAYIATADNGKGVHLTEAVVLHQGSYEQNVFVFVHASSVASASLDALQSKWVWQ